MSSRDIAVLVESRHSDVMRTIERLISNETISGYAPTAYTHEQNGQQYHEYLIGKRDSYVVVAQLSPQFTARLVDRWQELEEQAAPQIPQTYSEALQLAADQAKLIEEQRPKVEVYEKLANRKGDVSTTIIAKQLGYDCSANVAFSIC